MAAAGRWSWDCDLAGKSRKNEVVAEARERQSSLAFVFPLIGTQKVAYLVQPVFHLARQAEAAQINLFAAMHKTTLNSRSTSSSRNFLKGTTMTSALALVN